MKAIKSFIIILLISIPPLMYASSWNTYLTVKIYTDMCTNCGACDAIAPGWVTSNGSAYYFVSDPMQYLGYVSKIECYDQSQFDDLREMADACPTEAMQYESKRI